MKKHIIPAVRLTLVTLFFFSVIYTVFILGIAQLAPNNGKGELIEHEGKKYYSNIGQAFTQEKYFHSRPSAVDYNAAGSGASNKAASNEEYLQEVEGRINTFLLENPEVEREEIPVDLVTTSASGLDPHISVQAAKVQLKRIAEIRNIAEERLEELIEEQTEKSLFGLFGTEKINVFKLNIALERENR